MKKKFSLFLIIPFSAFGMKTLDTKSTVKQTSKVQKNSLIEAKKTPLKDTTLLKSAESWSQKKNVSALAKSKVNKSVVLEKQQVSSKIKYPNYLATHKPFEKEMKKKKDSLQALQNIKKENEELKEKILQKDQMILDLQASLKPADLQKKVYAICESWICEKLSDFSGKKDAILDEEASAKKFFMTLKKNLHLLKEDSSF